MILQTGTYLQKDTNCSSSIYYRVGSVKKLLKDGNNFSNQTNKFRFEGIEQIFAVNSWYCSDKCTPVNISALNDTIAVCIYTRLDFHYVIQLRT